MRQVTQSVSRDHSRRALKCIQLPGSLARKSSSGMSRSRSSGRLRTKARLGLGLLAESKATTMLEVDRVVALKPSEFEQGPSI